MVNQRMSREGRLNSALGEIARGLLLEGAMESIAPIVLEKAKALSRSKFGFIGHAVGDTGKVADIVSDRWDPLCPEGVVRPVWPEAKGRLWGWLLRNRRTLIANAPPAVHSNFKDLIGDLPISRLLAVPILAREEIIGLIVVANADTDYAGEDVLALEQIADLYARGLRQHQENNKLRLFRRLVDQSNDAVYVVDPQSSRFLEINEAAHRFLGYERAEFLEKRVIDISATDPDLATWQRGVDYLRTVPYHVFEGEQIHRDGTRLPVEVNVRLIRQDDQEYMISMARDIRDRKMAADATIKERNKLEAVLTALGDGVTLQDRQFRILYQNEAHKKKQGDRQGELCYRAYHGREQICPGCLLALCFEDGKTHRRETSSLGVDGKTVYMEVAASPVRDAHGAIYAGIETVRDITEQKLAAEALRENRRMLKQVLDSVPQAIFWKDRNSVYLGCNQPLAKAAGLSSPDQIVGKTDFDLPWLKEESEAYRADDQYVMSNNVKKLHIIEPLQLAEGERLWIDTCKVPLVDEQDRVYGVLGVYEDITARKRVEKALLDSESRYRLLFESAGDAIIVSLNDIVTECNEKALELFGCHGRGQIINEPILKFSAETQLDGRPASAVIPEKIAAALQGEAQSFPWRHIRCDGGVLETEVTLNRIDLGRAGNLLAIIRDVTAQKQAELQLRQAQKMESIGTLAGGIAHDFNNILNAIVGYTDLAMLRGQDEAAGLQDDLQQVRIAANRATALVRQILTFSRKRQKEKTPLQISLVVKEAMQLLRASIPTTIEMRQEISAGGMVLADSTEIHQLVMNLCTNAAHAMMARGGVLAVSLAEELVGHKRVDGGIELAPGRYMLLSVSDTGCGMDQETMSKIFEPYFTTKELGRGTGLGLAVVHGIVKGQQGEIVVGSEPGRGTTFKVYLPMIAREVAWADDEYLPPVSGAQGRVMVVDDEDAIRNLVSRVLIQAGYRVEAFADGLAAWQALSQRPRDWDLLVTDQTMPKLTGEQLAVMARGIRPDLPIILCSGYNANMADQQITQSGVSVFLQKPVSRGMLLAQVAKALGQAQ